MVKKRPSAGRQRIPMARIQKESHRQVTFSKRRVGLFKKASELCTLCGVQIGIIVFSPAKKAFSFGHPNVESIVDRYLAGENNADNAIPHEPPPNVEELNLCLKHVCGENEQEKKRRVYFDQLNKDCSSQNCWDAPIDELGPNELVKLKAVLENLKQKIAEESNYKVMVQSTAPIYYQFSENVLNMTDGASASASDYVPNFGTYGHRYP